MCKEGDHRFTLPVIVSATQKNSLVWFLMLDTITKEVAVSVCQKCGEIVMAGWGVEND